MATTTSTDTTNWDSYGKWTLVALVLLLLLVSIVGVIFTWQQGYFDTIVTRGRTKGGVPKNFTSYKPSTTTTQMRTSTLPSYVVPLDYLQARELGCSPEVPTPLYQANASTRERSAQSQYPLPIVASPNPYSGPLIPPEAVVNPWRTGSTPLGDVTNTAIKTPKSKTRDSSKSRTVSGPPDVPSSTVSVLADTASTPKLVTSGDEVSTSPATGSSAPERTATPIVTPSAIPMARETSSTHRSNGTASVQSNQLTNSQTTSRAYKKTKSVKN